MALSFSQACLEWARSKPASERYDYDSCRNCAVAQFLIDTGRAVRPDVCGTSWRCWRQPAAFGAFDQRIDDAARNDYDRSGWTFGAFADRLARALA